MKKILILLCFLFLLINCNNEKNKKSSYILVEGGTFLMGNNLDNEEEDAKPVHEVTLDSFYISRYEVTQKEFKELMGYNPSNFKGDNNPVENVTWFDTVIYANKLSEKEGLPPYYKIDDIRREKEQIISASITIIGGKGYRLPTEAEWEYAAWGGIKSNGTRYSGSNDIREVAWYKESRTSPVGKKISNELEIYDMNGNVSEWCWDWYGDYTESSIKNPIGLLDGTYSVLRGGSWDSEEMESTITYRYRYSPDSFSESIGFRLVRSYSETSKGEYQQTENYDNEKYSDDYILEEKYQVYVRDFKRVLKTRDKSKIAELIRFPLDRDYPIPDIQNSKEFIERFDQVFDEVFINKILDSSTERDWEFLGWRGINFTEGLMLMDENGYIKHINYSTKKEKIYKQVLLDEYKNSLPKSLQNFELPILSMETKQFIVKIDKMKDDSYRCCLWILGEDMSETPDIIVENGTVTYEGSGGNHFYSFNDNKCEYNIYVYSLRNSLDPPAMLETIDEDNTIRHEKAFLFNN